MHIAGKKEGQLKARYLIVKSGNSSTIRKQWSEIWFIITDDETQTETEVRTEIEGVVVLGEEVRDAKLRGIELHEIATVISPVTGNRAFLYEAELQFDSEGVPDLENFAVQRRSYTEEEEDILYVDAITGEPVQTANYEPIILTHPVRVIILEITRYEEKKPWVDLLDIKRKYIDHVNADEFYGWPPRYARMLDITFDEEAITNPTGDDTIWIKATYKIGFKEKMIPEGNPDSPSPQLLEHPGWLAVVLHEGYMVRELDPVTGTYKSPELHLDPKTRQPTRRNLDINGVSLPDGAPPFYLMWHRFPEADFSELNLEE